MQTPTLGSAVAMLVASVIYIVWPSAPSAVTRPTVALGTTPHHDLPKPGYAALCEVPCDRATVHWIEYLELRHAAGAREGERAMGDRAMGR